MNRHRQTLVKILIRAALAFGILCAAAAKATQVSQGFFNSIQMNVDANGDNITGDAAQEPSIAIDAAQPDHFAASWKQFNAIGSSKRQAGHAYSADAGGAWTFPGVLSPGWQYTNMSLAADSAGGLFFLGLEYDATGSFIQQAQVFTSIDGGQTWAAPVSAYGADADKARIGVDNSGGASNGFIYLNWREGLPNQHFTRSTDHGVSFEPPVDIPDNPSFGQIAIAPNGNTYISGHTENGALDGLTLIYDNFLLAASLNAQDAAATPVFTTQTLNLGGSPVMFQYQNNPNQFGPVGDVQIGADVSSSALRGNLYILAPVQQTGTGDPLDLMFISSVDGGVSWSGPLKINNDPPNPNAYQWFPMMGVAPNSRLDAVWYDTRDALKPALSRLYYAYSWDGGITWRGNTPVTPSFNTQIGYPVGAQKIGDYGSLVSDAAGAHVAYTATYNGEQDVYYLHVFPDCNNNGVSDVTDIANRVSGDVNHDHIPDECESFNVKGDVNHDMFVDLKDINLIMTARNQAAARPSDPRDLDLNGIINILDARLDVLLCTRPNCAN